MKPSAEIVERETKQPSGLAGDKLNFMFSSPGVDFNTGGMIVANQNNNLTHETINVYLKCSDRLCSQNTIQNIYRHVRVQLAKFWCSYSIPRLPDIRFVQEKLALVTKQRIDRISMGTTQSLKYLGRKILHLDRLSIVQSN